MSYDASMFYIKKYQFRRTKKSLKKFITIFNRLAKSKEKLEKLKEDFV